MSFQKGDSKPAGAGRRKGGLNKTTSAIKEMLVTSLRFAGDEVAKEGETGDLKGGAAYLAYQAIKQPKAYMGLINKLIPTEVIGELNVGTTVELIDLSENRGKNKDRGDENDV